MSEREAGNRETDNSAPETDASQAGGRGQHERDKDEFEAGTSYQPSTNQAQDEPLPASHHDDGGKEKGRRGEPVPDDPSPRGQDQEEE